MNTIILLNSNGGATVILEQDDLLKHIWFVRDVQVIDGKSNSIPTPFRYGFNSIEVTDKEVLVSTYRVKDNKYISKAICHFKKVGEDIYQDDFEETISLVNENVDSSKERT